ncbi:hypothetical protein [Vibrio parahaemolyticus]|uniref:hypothetical protein n=1 Tax=Vibrio parahaemolyticus TaxID=670 RepID=UPI001869CC84|nr:hypothetical protein [Vibrio parahaemolyticus]MBE3843013.1 hypothetical protein [Vibrio parahaemolyticus]MBE3942423.1 hypothetical protein [Vibrio parahaemolyticus]MBE4118867.1 hypothetical protein [Vibrio parahaemolyticus]MBE4779015.1 hypothetical protein [Vibrio parahaemolyticus]MEA5288808.1 hypothetical protein [Vibrio parahaemolyticus]
MVTIQIQPYWVLFDQGLTVVVWVYLMGTPEYMVFILYTMTSNLYQCVDHTY